jgi:hypothetical protein
MCYVHNHKYTYTSIHVDVCIENPNEYMTVDIYTFVKHMCIHIHIQKERHVHTYIYICIYMHIHLYTHASPAGLDGSSI